MRRAAPKLKGMNREERLVAAVREACVQAAVAAYEDGGMRGLCAEGRWELALEAIRDLDLSEVAGSRSQD